LENLYRFHTLIHMFLCFTHLFLLSLTFFLLPLPFRFSLSFLSSPLPLSPSLIGLWKPLKISYCGTLVKNLTEETITSPFLSSPTSAPIPYPHITSVSSQHYRSSL
jgi:hypothetical protein